MTCAPVIHIVDDDLSFRTAMSRLLQTCGYQISLYESGDQILAALPTMKPGCILLDVNMSGLGGLQLQDRLLQLNISLPIIFLTGYGDIPTSVRAIKAGAEDFLSKPVSKQTLLESIERALVRYRHERAENDRLTAGRAMVAKLTPRETEVFQLVVRGRLNKQIAFELGASERTIKAHRHSIMRKLGVQSVAEAVSIAELLGLIADR